MNHLWTKQTLHLAPSKNIFICFCYQFTFAQNLISAGHKGMDPSVKHVLGVLEFLCGPWNFSSSSKWEFFSGWHPRPHPSGRRVLGALLGQMTRLFKIFSSSAPTITICLGTDSSLFCATFHCLWQPAIFASTTLNVVFCVNTINVALDIFHLGKIFFQRYLIICFICIMWPIANIATFSYFFGLKSLKH